MEDHVPTYQYSCTECDHAFEQFQSFSDDALSECPRCSGRLRKVYNAVGVVFKGSGFYRTDSRTTKDDSAPAAKADGTGDKSATTGSDTSPTKSPAAASAATAEKGAPAKSPAKTSTAAAGSGSAA
jgi:putative FmdB family regulatory protein